MLFINDVDLVTDVSNTKLKMWQIINIYNKLYGAIGGYIEGFKI